MEVRANPATAIQCHPWLDDAACDAVVAGLRAEDFDPGLVLGPAGRGEVRDGAVRSCGLLRLPEGPILHAIDGHLAEVNAATFRFDLDGRAADDPVTLMRYERGDHFDWHIDNGVDRPPQATRKLGFTIQLSDPADYVGGDLEFAMYRADDAGGQASSARRELARRRGTILVFAAFQPHRVTPVTRGVRLAIVGWLHGPAFR
jgi:hypothetical protein